MMTQSSGLLAVAVFLGCSSLGEAGAGILRVKLHKRHRLEARSLVDYRNHAKSLDSVNQQGNVTLNDIGDLYYCGEISVGTPRQRLIVDFDTGSADLWVPSRELCRHDRQYCRHHSTYAHKRSSSYRKIGKPFTITYGSGEVSGYTSQDNVNIAGMTITGQVLGEVIAIDQQTAQSQFDGILGLAYPALSEMKVKPPFVKLVEQQAVNEPVFAFYLNKVSTGGVGELVLGGVDPKHYTGDITYTPVTEKLYWQINVERVVCGLSTVANNIRAIPDSGTSLMVGPSDVTDPINQMIGGQEEGDGIYVVNCTNVDQLPDVHLSIAGITFTLNPSDYIVQTEEDTGEVVCISSFVGLENLGFFILGDVFMRKFYTVFDMGQDRVGFARGV